MELGEAPAPASEEDVDGYFRHNEDYWMLAADDVANKEGIKVSEKKLKKAAKKMAAEYFEHATSEKK